MNSPSSALSQYIICLDGEGAYTYDIYDNGYACKLMPLSRSSVLCY